MIKCGDSCDCLTFVNSADVGVNCSGRHPARRDHHHDLGATAQCHALTTSSLFAFIVNDWHGSQLLSSWSHRFDVPALHTMPLAGCQLPDRITICWWWWLHLIQLVSELSIFEQMAILRPGTDWTMTGRCVACHQIFGNVLTTHTLVHLSCWPPWQPSRIKCQNSHLSRQVIICDF